MRTNELMLYKNMEYGEILKDITFLIDHYESEYYNREDLRALLFDCINELLELSVSHGLREISGILILPFFLPVMRMHTAHPVRLWEK